MRRVITSGLLAASFVLSVAAQDWYHEREERYRGERWRSQVFLQVRSDLDHVWSASRASDKERRRLERTKEELTELQAKLDHGEFDNGILNDVIDSIQKSSNDDRLSPRDRSVLRDDLERLHDYQNNHNRWRR